VNRRAVAARKGVAGGILTNPLPIELTGTSWQGYRLAEMADKRNKGYALRIEQAMSVFGIAA
jgi:hypothetical protein